MSLPFTQEQFLNVFAAYNTATWPAQVLFYVAAIFVTYLVVKKKQAKLAGYLLSVMWIWTGVVYHIAFFSTINKIALAFGILFVLQGILFGVLTYRNQIPFSRHVALGLGFIVFALLLYPLLGFAFGHAYPAMPIFPLPCPLTIFTFGIMVMATRLPKYAVIIPSLWALLGFTAVINFHVYQDVALLVAAIVGDWVVMRNKQYENKKLSKN